MYGAPRQGPPLFTFKQIRELERVADEIGPDVSSTIAFWRPGMLFLN